MYDLEVLVIVESLELGTKKDRISVSMCVCMISYSCLRVNDRGSVGGFRGTVRTYWYLSTEYKITSCHRNPSSRYYRLCFYVRNVYLAQ